MRDLLKRAAIVMIIIITSLAFPSTYVPTVVFVVIVAEI